MLHHDLQAICPHSVSQNCCLEYHVSVKRLCNMRQYLYASVFECMDHLMQLLCRVSSSLQLEAQCQHIAYVYQKTRLLCRRQYNIPPFSYLKSNRQAALVLFPTDWAINNAEPLAPHMVAVGAITAAPAKALPSELEEFMLSAGDHGVVYASLGTTAIPGDCFQSSKGA